MTGGSIVVAAISDQSILYIGGDLQESILDVQVLLGRSFIEMDIIFLGQYITLLVGNCLHSNNKQQVKNNFQTRTL